MTANRHGSTTRQRLEAARRLIEDARAIVGDTLTPADIVRVRRMLAEQDVK